MITYGHDQLQAVAKIILAKQIKILIRVRAANAKDDSMRHQAYEYEVMNRLTKVKTHGTTEILKEELKYWYDAQRVTVNIWRDLHDRWKSIEPKRTNKLLLAETSSSWILIWGFGLETNATSWFKDVRQLAGRTDATGRVVAA